MAMRIPRTDYEMDSPDPGVTEKEFRRRGDLKEGVSGCDRFDSRYENTQRRQVLDPHGDQAGRPMPRDARFREADNHGEWGQDTYRERLEYGMDGPNETRIGHGLGLPSREDLRPIFPPIESDPAPSAEGIDGDN